ncbi:type II toxin-antitoxin system antitoxin SocA domain-containing protein [Sulfitobacter sp.]|uniref:type II toxin-antitoxin system antitoxin SocA domain-containing protein n=1 Tax=Sulfitobacter sp. TaxID=1903071 RepID=UPI0035672E3C
MYGYNEKKAGQVVAFFGLKAGGQINVLKLAKLLYLAERDSMAAYDEPMFYDKLVSMDHGPVTSISLNLVNGMQPSDVWPLYLSGRAGYDVIVNDTISLAELDELSKADLTILNTLWEKFGQYSQYQIRDWTHENCQEWENPQGSSEPIPHERVFKFLGKKEATSLAESLQSFRAMHKRFEAVC